MTREEAIERLNIHKSTNVFVDSIAEAIDMAIEALSAEEAVWNEYEAEFTDLPDIPRYYYEKVVGKMAHEINMLKEQLESADAVQEAVPTVVRVTMSDGSQYYLEHERDAIQAEAVQGEWIHDGQNFKGGLDWCHCSECGHKTSTNGLSVYRFCPNCGARMEANE